MSKAVRKLTGCRMLHYAPVTIQGSQVTFGEITPIPNIEEYSYTFLYAEASNYADNMQNIYMKKITGADISLMLSDLALAVEAEMMGKQTAKGGAVTNTNDIQKAIAVLWEETYSDGSAVRNVFYNSKLSKEEVTGKTEGENVEFTPVNLVGKAIPLPNGDIHYKLDNSEADYDTDKFEKWFTKVQTLQGEALPSSLSAEETREKKVK